MKKLILTVILFHLGKPSFSAIIFWSLLGGWFPAAPTTADSTETIQIIDGSPVLSSDIAVESITIDGGASLVINGSSSTFLVGKIEVKTSGTLTVQASSIINIGSDIENHGTISIENGCQIIQRGSATNSGSGTYNISATGTGSATQYNLWSSPVSGGSITSVFGSSNDCDIYHFSASGQEWVRMSTSSLCEPAAPFTGSTSFSSGYGVSIPGGGSATFTGAINNGDVSPSLSSASSGGTWTGDGWNLIGNPYPSTINATDFINGNANITGTLYFWDDDGSAGAGYDQDADFATRNLGGGTAASGGGGSGAPTDYIGVGQGFFVQHASGSSATFSNSMREAGTSTFFKTEPENIQRVWLNANQSGIGSNQILIAFTDNATNGVDWGYDSKKLVSNPNFVFGSSIEQENEPFVIQSLNKDVLEHEKEIDISLFTNTAGVVSIDLGATENFDSNVVVYLKDYATGKIQDLSTGPFSVYLNANKNYDSRFAIVFKNAVNGPTSVSNTPKPTYVNGYESQGTLFIKSPKEGLKSIRIVNMNGSVIETVSVNGNNYSEIGVSHLSSGLYVAQVSTISGFSETIKFVIE